MGKMNDKKLKQAIEDVEDENKDTGLEVIRAFKAFGDDEEKFKERIKAANLNMAQFNLLFNDAQSPITSCISAIRGYLGDDIADEALLKAVDSKLSQTQFNNYLQTLPSEVHTNVAALRRYAFNLNKQGQEKGELDLLLDRMEDKDIADEHKCKKDVVKQLIQDYVTGLVKAPELAAEKVEEKNADQTVTPIVAPESAKKTVQHEASHAAPIASKIPETAKKVIEPVAPVVSERVAAQSAASKAAPVVPKAEAAPQQPAVPNTPAVQAQRPAVPNVPAAPAPQAPAEEAGFSVEKIFGISEAQLDERLKAAKLNEAQAYIIRDEYGPIQLAIATVEEQLSKEDAAKALAIAVNPQYSDKQFKQHIQSFSKEVQSCLTNLRENALNKETIVREAGYARYEGQLVPVEAKTRPAIDNLLEGLGKDFDRGKAAGLIKDLVQLRSKQLDPNVDAKLPAVATSEPAPRVATPSPRMIETSSPRLASAPTRQQVIRRNREERFSHEDRSVRLYESGAERTPLPLLFQPASRPRNEIDEALKLLTMMAAALTVLHFVNEQYQQGAFSPQHNGLILLTANVKLATISDEFEQFSGKHSSQQMHRREIEPNMRGFGFGNPALAGGFIHELNYKVRLDVSIIQVVEFNPPQIRVR